MQFPADRYKVQRKPDTSCFSEWDVGNMSGINMESNQRESCSWVTEEIKIMWLHFLTNQHDSTFGLLTTKAHEETDINAYIFKRLGGMGLTYVPGRGTISLIQYRHDSLLADEGINLQDFEGAYTIRGLRELVSPERTGENSQRGDMRGIP